VHICVCIIKSTWYNLLLVPYTVAFLSQEKMMFASWGDKQESRLPAENMPMVEDATACHSRAAHAGRCQCPAGVDRWCMPGS